MGNVLTPEAQPKNVKLKNIVSVLKQQQTKIKNHRRQCVNKIQIINRRLKHNLMQKKQSPFTEISIEDNIRECAEEILYQKKRLTDLKTCYEVLNSLQYKVQNIMDAYYTQNTLQTVNNSIRDSNINIHNDVPLDTGVLYIPSGQCWFLYLLHKHKLTVSRYKHRRTESHCRTRQNRQYQQKCKRVQIYEYRVHFRNVKLSNYVYILHQLTHFYTEIISRETYA